jgi:hypothetical protein
VQGSNLRGKEFNLTLHWHVMPKTGKMLADKLVMSGFRLPEEYRWWQGIFFFFWFLINEHSQCHCRGNRIHLKTPGETTGPISWAIRVYTLWQASLQPYLPLLLLDEPPPTKYGMIKVSLIKNDWGRNEHSLDFWVLVLIFGLCWVLLAYILGISCSGPPQNPNVYKAVERLPTKFFFIERGDLWTWTLP